MYGSVKEILFIKAALFLGAFAKLQKATFSFVMSAVCLSVSLPVCPPAWNNSAPTGWIFMKFDI
jgi:hypothetical protein